MKSFSQFLAEKESLSPFYDQYGKQLPWSKVTRQDVGMASKDPINVTPDVDDVKTNKVNKISKKTSDSGKIVFKPKPGEKTASNLIVKQHTPGTNLTVKGSNTYVNPNQNRITSDRTVKNIVNTSDAKRILDNKPRVNVNKIDPNVNKVTTNIKKPNNFSSFLDRVFKATGVKTQSKYKSKFLTPSSNVSLGVDSKKVLSDVGKNALRSKILRGLGRFAGGVYAGKDFYDKQKEERIKGRSRTSQIVGGLSKALGGYVGGAIGATAGTLAGGGLGSFALGTGGAITGYNIGSRIGDQLYKTGRQYATGERKLNLGKTFKNLKKDINTNLKKIRNKSDK